MKALLKILLLLLIAMSGACKQNVRQETTEKQITPARQAVAQENPARVTPRAEPEDKTDVIKPGPKPPEPILDIEPEIEELPKK